MNERATQAGVTLVYTCTASLKGEAMVDASPQATAFLAHEEIVAISRDVLRRYSPALEFVGVMASEGGSGRVEIMVIVNGCHAEPCRLLLNLSRTDRGTLETELRRTLQKELQSHITRS
jgi:hypothetical protein